MPQVCLWYRVLKDKTNSSNNIELESDEIGYLAEDLLSRVLREWLDYSWVGNMSEEGIVSQKEQ